MFCNKLFSLSDNPFLEWLVGSATCHSLQSGPVDELLLQIHGCAYPDASGACCGSDDVLVQELFS